MAGSYHRSLQLAKQLEKKAKEASKKKADAESKLQAAESIKELCLKINADTSDLEGLLNEASAALGSKDFYLAQKKAENAVRAANNTFIGKVNSILDNAEEMGRLIEEVGGKDEKLDKLISDTRSALEKEDFEKSIKLVDKTWTSFQKALHEQYGDAYSRAQQIILKAKESGEDIEDLERDLKETKALIESEDYGESLSAIKSVLESASEMLRSRISSDLDSIEDKAFTAEDFGADSTKVKEYLSKARDLLEANEFDEASSIARKAQSEVDKSISSSLNKEIRQLKDDIRAIKKHGADMSEISSLIEDAAKSSRDKEISTAINQLEKARSGLKDTQFKMVLKAIANSRDRLVLAKKVGADISGAITLINESRDKLRTGHFEVALNAAHEAENEVDAALSSFNDAKEKIEELTKLKTGLDEIGIEIPSELMIFKDAKEAFAQKDFALSSERAEKGLKAINGLVRELAEEQLKDAEDFIEEIAPKNADVKEAQKLLQSANESLMERNILGAYKKAVESAANAKLAARELIHDKISSLEGFLDGLSNSLDVSKHKEQLDSIMELFDGGTIIEAFDKLDTIKDEIREKGAKECERLINEANLKVGEIEAAGLDAAPLSLMISKAEEHHNNGRFEICAATAIEAIEDADSALKDLAKKSIFSFKQSFEDAHGSGIDTAKWRTLFKQSRKMFESDDFLASIQVSRKALDEMKNVTSERAEIMAKIVKMEGLLKEAKENRIDVSQFGADIETGKKAIGNFEFDKATSVLDKAEEGIEKAMAMYLAAKLILVIKPSVEYADREHIPIDIAKGFLDKAKSYMKNRDYYEALASAKRGKDEIAKAFEQGANERIQNIQSLIADARNVGVDTSRPEKLIEQSQAGYNEGDFEASMKSAVMASQEIDKIKELSSKSAIEIRIAKERIRDGEAIGLDMGDPRSVLDQAIDALNSHKYAISFELSKKAGTQAMDTIKEDLERILGKLSERVAQKRDSGASTEIAESQLEKARYAFEAMEIKESLNIMMECERELERIDLQYDIALNALEVAKRRLENARNEDLNVPKAEDILSDAEAAMSEKNFTKVIELSIALGDVVEHIKRQMDSCHLDMNSLEERLERLRRIGLEPESAEEYLKRAEEAIQKADFVSCRETCIEGERIISVELEKIISAGFNEVDKLIETAVILGLKDREYIDTLEVAKTSAKEGLWDFAYEQTQKCKSEVGSAIIERLKHSLKEIQSTMNVIRKTGASVGMVEEKIREIESKIESEEYDDAFEIILDAETLASKIESLHKEYLDAKYAAESAISMAKKFGMNTREGERLLDMAEIELEKDYNSAIELAHEAAESSMSSLNRYNPNLEISVKPVNLREGHVGKIVVTIKNKGKALVKDPEMEISTDIEMKDIPKLPQLKGGETKQIEIETVPEQTGDVDFSITINAKRLFDGKNFEFSVFENLKVAPGEPTARMARAEKTVKCAICNGKIRPGFDIAICNKCENLQHWVCAKRTKKCGNCDTPLAFD